MRGGQTTLTAADSVLGTPEYMSPEQARGAADVDHRTDLYSAGVVLYEMLTGRTPFHADTPTATIHQILNNEPADPRSIDRDVDPVLASVALRLMAKQPEDRLASAKTALELLEAQQPIHSVERRRRARRRAIGAVVVIVLVALTASGAWLIGKPPTSERLSQEVASTPTREAITGVKIDEANSRRLLVRYGYNNTWYLLHEFPRGVETITDCVEVDLDGQGRIGIAAGIERPLGSSGNALFLFDGSGSELWAKDLSDGHRWPDAGPPRKWACRTLRVYDLDGIPGDELIAVGHDISAYASGIFVIDPNTAEVRSAFWHAGAISSLEVLPDFFEIGDAAILTWGVNNKLDGQGDPVPPEYRGPRYTQYAIVSVAMILDPRDMAGLGPPRAGFLPPIPAARPYAYIFLDLPTDRSAYYPAGANESVNPVASDCARIDDCFSSGEFPRPDDSGPWLSITLSRHPEAQPGGGTLVVDRNLNIREFRPGESEVTGRLEEYWQQRWHPIIQNYEYVE
ncbi:MAG: hypothetical protein KKB50_06590 [Planctomycetes bacterium]|nr:hypothetical protein [Planctomycetota bacterium]